MPTVLLGKEILLNSAVHKDVERGNIPEQHIMKTKLIQSFLQLLCLNTKVENLIYGYGSLQNLLLFTYYHSKLWLIPTI